MEQLLAGIEQWPLARYLRASLLAYPLVNALHIAAIGVVLTSVMFLHGRAAGLFPAFRAHEVETSFRRTALAAFAIAVLSGLALFSIRAREYAANPAFLAKMLLLVLAGANLALYLAVPRWRIAGAVASMVLWIAALITGRLVGFV